MAKREKMLQKEQERVQEENQRSGVGRALLSSVLMIGLGVLLFLRPDFGSSIVTTVLGWVLIGVGAVGIVTCILSWPVLGFGQILLSVGMAAFGVFVLIRPDLLTKIIFAAVGIYLVLQGGGNLLEGFKLKKLGYSSIPSMVLAAVLLILGLLMVFCPGLVQNWIMMVLGGIMIACGLSNLVFRTLAVKKLRQPKDDNVVDADD